MAFKTKITDFTPAAQKFKVEITLPSGGYSNPTAFPGGKLTVYPWDSSLSEWMVKAPKNDLSFLATLVGKITHLKSDIVRTMVSSELQLITMVSRALTFPDSKITYSAKCPVTTCGAVEHAAIKIPDQLQRTGEKPADYLSDTVTLPICQDVLTIRPVTVGEEETANSRPEEYKYTVSDSDSVVIASIRSVGGETADTLTEAIRYYRALHPADSEFLQRELVRLSPGVSTTVDHVCDKCGTRFSYDLNLAVDFFRR